ncbi:hypothetical protein BC629DRAFT_142448 [Irpex lacteus]|nr:hypothetical protein BC629DRAFT_142448 [Irpex lacteus]
MCFRRNSAILACSRLTLLLLSSDLKLGVFLSPLRTFATMSTSRESPSVSTRLSAPLGFIPGGWNESFSSPEHEQLSTDPSQSVSSSKQDTSKEQVVSFTPSTRGGRHSFKKSTVPPPSDRTSVAAARGRYGFSHKMKEFFSLHSKPQGKLQPSATSDTNASRQLRFSFRKKVSPENHSDHPSPTVAATHTHDQSQTVRSVSAGAFLANPQLRQAPHAGRRTGARYSFRASSRPIELSFEDGRTSPLGSAHGSHTTHDDGLSPEIKSYAPGDQQSSVVSHSTSPHPETVSALLTTEHRVSISPMSPIMGTSHKPWRSKRQAGTVQRTIPDPQQSSPSADPSPALRPPEIPHRHSPPYSGADQVENHVHAPRRLRFNFGERRHGDSELSAATNASVGGSGSQERSVAVPSDYDQPSITSRNHRRLRFNFGERHHGDSELSAVTDAGMGGSGSQERPVAGPSNYDQSSGVDHRRAEKWLRRIMGEPRPRPAAPTKRPKRRHHTAAPLAQTAVIQFAQPESDNAEDSSPYQAQLVGTIFML